MLDWITYKCLSLARSFDDLLNDESHWGELLEIIEPLPPAMQSFWMSEAVLAVLEMHCDFVRRFLVDASQFPHAILWLIKSPPDTPCSDRQRCAFDALKVTREQNATIWKLRTLFEKELQHAAREGVLQEELWDLIALLAAHWYCSTQDVEGANNSIKYITTLAPNIKWGLMSSRVTIKKTIGSAASKAEREMLVSRCCEVVPQVREFLQELEHTRWTEARPSAYPIGVDVARPPRVDVHPCVFKLIAACKRAYKARFMEWDVSTTCVLGLRMVANSPEEYEYGAGPSETVLWLPTVKHYSQLWCTRGGVMVGDGPDEVCLVVEPLDAKPWASVLDSAHTKVVEGCVCEVEIRIFELQWDITSFRRATITFQERLLLFADVCRCAAGPTHDDGLEPRVAAVADDEALLHEAAELESEWVRVGGNAHDDAEELTSPTPLHTPAEIHRLDGLISDMPHRASELLEIEASEETEERCVESFLNLELAESIELCSADAVVADSAAEAYEAWRNMWESNTSEVCSAFDFVKRPVCGQLVNKHVSLAAISCDMSEDLEAVTPCWIAWEDGSDLSAAGPLIGRVVLLDESNRVIYAMPSGKRDLRPQLTSGQLEIWVANTTARMTRVRGAGREPVPKEVLQVRDVLMRAHVFGTIGGSLLCALCKRLEMTPTRDADHSWAHLLTCAVCKIATHVGCLRQLLDSGYFDSGARCAKLESIRTHHAFSEQMALGMVSLCCACHGALTSTVGPIGDGDTHAPL